MEDFPQGKSSIFLFGRGPSMNAEKRSWANIITGFILVIGGGLAAYFLGRLHLGVGPLVLGIVVGIVIRTIIGKWISFQQGLGKSIRILIPAGIILYGTHLEFVRLVEVPTQVWLQLLVGTTVIIFIVRLIGPKIGLTKALSLLIGVGTAICGASAIVIAAPVVEADTDETAKSLVTITILGLIGMLLWPYIGRWLGFSTDQYALFCSTTLHQTGQVKTAASAFGSEALSMATLIKMARIMMIIPMIPLAGILSKFDSFDQAVHHQTGLRIRIPWFLWIFIFVGLISSYVKPVAENIHYIRPLASIVWTMAMVSVGMLIDIKKIASSLSKPLLLGLFAWIGAIAVFLIGS